LEKTFKIMKSSHLAMTWLSKNYTLEKTKLTSSTKVLFPLSHRKERLIYRKKTDA